MRNGGARFKVKVLSFKIRFCNGDSETYLTPATSQTQRISMIKTILDNYATTLFNRAKDD